MCPLLRAETSPLGDDPRRVGEWYPPPAPGSNWILGGNVSLCLN